jgi:hypothetical protein
MVCFQTKNPILGKFWRVLQWKMMIYFMDTWSILRSFVIFYGHLVQFVVIWYIFPVLIFCTKKILATLLHIQEITVPLGDKVQPWGPTLLLASHFALKGDIKNWPQVLACSNFYPKILLHCVLVFDYIPKMVHMYVGIALEKTLFSSKYTFKQLNFS